MLLRLVVHSKRYIHIGLHISVDYFDRATRDIDKPEVEPVGEPESLHSCVLSREG